MHLKDFSTKATEWGNTYEPVALEKYQAKCGHSDIISEQLHLLQVQTTEVASQETDFCCKLQPHCGTKTNPCCLLLCYVFTKKEIEFSMTLTFGKMKS